MLIKVNCQNKIIQIFLLNIHPEKASQVNHIRGEAIKENEDIVAFFIHHSFNNSLSRSTFLTASTITIGTLPYNISQYLVELIQPTLSKSKYKITHSSSFVNEAKNWLVKKMKSKCLMIS